MRIERVTVVKVGGNELDDTTFLAGLCTAVAAFNGPLILVHGGGKEITAALEQAGLHSEFVAGLRVTTPAAMAVMQQVVCGTINKRLVQTLLNAGTQPLGLSGLDLGLLRCQPYRPEGADLGRVGVITQVAATILHTMLAQGWLPVIAPVALGQTDGLSYNVNADMVAQAIAAAMPGAELLFVSNVPGVILAGTVVPQLDLAAVHAAIADGSINGGMVPKVRAALAALEAGASSARITNLAGFANGGTRFLIT